MEHRTLGKTGLSLSIIGMGGFHLVETEGREAERILNTYLDRGGNYIETAAEYGDGISEEKIGRSVSHRRSEFTLATKVHLRGKKEAEASINRSLSLLKTDAVDILFVHNVTKMKDYETIFGPGGAFEAIEAARKAGKFRFLAVSAHGRPTVLIKAIQEHSFDVVMTGFNYYDRFNFPQTEDTLLPLAEKLGMGILGMKALADGFLYRSEAKAIRYTLSLPIASLVLGINTMEMLERDLKIAQDFTPMTDEEREKLFETAPELGTYVCRQCGECSGSASGFDLVPSEVFLLEGLFDRQMDTKTLSDPASYSLRERLKHWFAQDDEARAEYSALGRKVDPSKDYSGLNRLCPYRIDIDRKLKIAHEKLSGTDYLYW